MCHESPALYIRRPLSIGPGLCGTSENAVPAN
jgi:hypothetical protein